MWDNRARDDDARGPPQRHRRAAGGAGRGAREADEEAARAARVEAELAVAKAKASDDQAVIAHQQLQIAKLTRQLYGQRSERTVRLLDQWSWRSRSSRVRPLRMRSPPSGSWPRPSMWWRSPASVLRASPSPNICGVSGWSSRARLFAFAVAARGCASWARTSPRRWR